MEHSEDMLSLPAQRTRSRAAADVERIARALEAAANGDFAAHVRLEPGHPFARIASAADRLIARNLRLARELTRVCRRVALDGRLSERANPSLLPGRYRDALSAFNELLDQLAWQAGETGAVCRSSCRTALPCAARRCASPAA